MYFAAFSRGTDDVERHPGRLPTLLELNAEIAIDIDDDKPATTDATPETDSAERSRCAQHDASCVRLTQIGKADGTLAGTRSRYLDPDFADFDLCAFPINRSQPNRQGSVLVNSRSSC